MKDCKGTEIAVGDKLIWARGSRNSYLVEAVVIGVKDGSVTLENPDKNKYSWSATKTTCFSPQKLLILGSFSFEKEIKYLDVIRALYKELCEEYGFEIKIEEIIPDLQPLLEELDLCEML